MRDIAAGHQGENQLKASLAFAAALVVLSVSTGTAWHEMQRPVSRVSATTQIVKEEPVVLVHITNHAAVPVEAWGVLLTADFGAGPVIAANILVDTSPSLSPPSPGRGRIMPGETRVERVPVSAVPLSAIEEISAVIFDDLSSEGSEGEVRSLLQERERRAHTLGVWLEVLRGAEGKPVPEARSDLRSALIALRQRMAAPAFGGGQSAIVDIEDLVSLSDASAFSARLTALTRVYELQRRNALRHVGR